MGYLINGLLILLLVIATLVIFYVSFRRKWKLMPSDKKEVEEYYQLENLIELVKLQLRAVFNQNIAELNLNEDETKKRERNKMRLKKATRSCSFGDQGAKEYVKSYMSEILEHDLGVNEETIGYAISFAEPEKLTAEEKYDIILYLAKQSYGMRAFAWLCDRFGWDELHSDGENEWYEITKEDIDAAFQTCDLSMLSYPERLDILTQRIYQRIYGHGVVDELRDMQIDGVSGGVSGYTATIYQNLAELEEEIPTGQHTYDSVWVFFRGKTIHLTFLGFGSQKELERVCKNIYRYESPGQLSASSGYIVNDMQDGSRVVVVRPGFAESWGFFVRKFNSITSINIEELITDQNNQLVQEVLKYLIKGCQVVVVTGDQGSGKTTLLKALIQYVEKSYPIRIEEQVFETWMRKIYPDRNILTMRETDTVSAQDGVNLSKKTDGTVCILGEVASYELASLIIQLSQAGTKMTMCTNHAMTTERLVAYFRNAILKLEGFSDEHSAEEQVVEAINFDIHMTKDRSGHRYIERITEIVPLETDADYSGSDSENLRKFFENQTQRKCYKTQDIIRYTPEGYQWVAPVSQGAAARILRNLSSSDQDKFLALQGQGV